METMINQSIISAARGEIPVDLLIKNVRLVNLLSAEITESDIAIHDTKIVGFGDYNAVLTVDAKGCFVAPGLIDGHVHLESSMLSPGEFARAVVPMGTTTVVADPHEIANVMGTAGLQFMLDATADLPLNVFFMIPSCVPATHLETAGAVISADDMRKWINHPRILGIGEMMNFPGVLFRDKQVLEKISVAGVKLVDGHAPLVRDKDLSAYIVAGISSDHESTAIEEAREKLQKGMFLMIREGSAARNLKDLLPLVNPLNSRNCGFVTDDRHPDFLMDYGHINSMVRQAIASGIDPLMALQMASLNTARHFGLLNKGAIAPGYDADIILFDNFDEFSIQKVYKNGRMVAENGKMVNQMEVKKSGLPPTVRLKELTLEDLSVPAEGKQLNVIEIVPNQLLTKKLVVEALIIGNNAVSDVSRDILKMVVIERHRATGNIGKGFVQGMGIKSGAIASTVAHDSHNLLVVGTNDEDMLVAVHEIEKMNGGQVIVVNGKVRQSLALPIAGLMSELPLQGVREKMDELNRTAQQLGCKLENPFMTLSFLSLPVIPELKLTDKGLVDISVFDFIPLFVD